MYPGDRVYSPWKIAVLDENPRETKTGKTLYRAFHDWSKQINDHKLNTSTQTNPSLHFTSQSKINSTWSIEHLDTNGVNVIRRFKLHNCWPAIVGDMQLNMEKDNELASFMVTIVYSHFEFDPIGSN